MHLFFTALDRIAFQICPQLQIAYFDPLKLQPKLLSQLTAYLYNGSKQLLIQVKNNGQHRFDAHLDVVGNMLIASLQLLQNLSI